MDSCIIRRAGIEGLEYVQSQAKKILNNHLTTTKLVIELERFDTNLVKQNISPGGSADIVSAIYFLSEILKGNSIS